MPGCYRRCSDAGTDEHSEECHREICGTIANDSEARCSECAELDATTDPWISIPTDDARKVERRYRRQCSTMHCWFVHRVYYKGMGHVRQWERIAIDVMCRDAIATLRQAAPSVRCEEDWRDPPALRYNAYPWIYFIAELYLSVAYRRGRQLSVGRRRPPPHSGE